MCGLFGWQWAKDKQPGKQQRANIGHILALENDKRGGHAWGVWSPHLILRGLGKAEGHSPRFCGLMSVFGHCRYATHGANILRNAHPFEQEGVFLSHNGVISNHYDLNREKHRSHQVDSQHILSQLVEKKPMTDLRGYGAIVWADDKDTDEIYMGKLSSNGSLFVALTDAGMLWSSEESAAKKAIKAGGLKFIQSFEIEAGKQYFAKGGAFFDDSDAKPSIKVSEPVTYQHWSGYNNGPILIKWCNTHLKAYHSCSCKPNDKDLDLVEIEMSKTPKLGEKGVQYIAPPKETAPVVVAKTIGPTSTTHGTDSSTPRWVPHCVRVACLNHQAGGTPYCAEHAAIAASQAEQRQNVEPILLTAEMVRVKETVFTDDTPDYGDFWCAIPKCIKLRKTGLRICEGHEAERMAKGPQPRDDSGRFYKPEMYAPPSKVKQPWQDDMRASWIDDDAQPDADTKLRMQQDLAAWWLETQHGLVDAALTGMTPNEILDAAIDFGFDPEEAVKVVLTPPVEEEEVSHEGTTAGVQQQKAEHEPQNGGSAGAVGGSPDPRPSHPTSLDVLRQGGSHHGGRS